MPRFSLDIAGLFGNADFRRTWGIGNLTGVARWLEFVAIAIFAFELTHSAEQVALLAVLRMIPYVALGLVVGGLADTFDRRCFLLVSLAVMIATWIVMAWLAHAGLATYGAVAVATLISGAFWTIDMPVRRRIMVDAIGPANMASGLGLDNSTNYATRAVGPMLGGLGYGLFGIEGIFIAMAAVYGWCLLLALPLPARRKPASGHEPAPFDIRTLLPSRALLADRRVQIAMGITLVYNLWCFPFVTMVPVIAQREFGLSHTLVGAISACDGIGGTIGALVAGALATERTLLRFYFWGPVIFLGLMLLLSLELTVAFAVPMLVLIGASAAAFSSTQYALIYTLSAPEMRGRATGLISMCIGSALVGHYHTGVLFERMGAAPAMQVMAAEGLVCLLVIGIVWWRHGARR